MIPVLRHRIVPVVVLVSFCLFSVVPVQAQPSRTITKEAELDAPGEVNLSVQAGRIQVTTWDRSIVRATVEITGKSAKAIESVAVRMEQRAGRVNIQTDGQEGGGILAFLGFGGAGGPEAHYRLHVPATTTLSISTDRAPVEVRGLEGDLNIQGASAPVRVRSVEGGVNAATFSGSLDADSVRGPINYATFSGDATVRMHRPMQDQRIASFSGDADISLPADAGFRLRTDLGWGSSVRSDFAMPDSSDGGEGPVVIGGGGPTIAFESFSGSLRLRATE